MRIWLEVEKGVEVPLCDKCGFLLFAGVLPSVGCVDCVDLMMQVALRRGKNKRKKSRKTRT